MSSVTKLTLLHTLRILRQVGVWNVPFASCAQRGKWNVLTFQLLVPAEQLPTNYSHSHRGNQMELYHFTNIANLLKIIQAGYLETSGSHLWLQQPSQFRRVVWLTTNQSHSHIVQAWTRGAPVINGRVDFNVEMLDSYNLNVFESENKTRIRFAVDIELSKSNPSSSSALECFEWEAWSRSLGRQENFAELQKTNGGNWQAWHVCENRIPWASWLEIVDTQSDEVLCNESGFTDAGQSIINLWAPIVSTIADDRAIVARRFA